MRKNSARTARRAALRLGLRALASDSACSWARMPVSASLTLRAVRGLALDVRLSWSRCWSSLRQRLPCLLLVPGQDAGLGLGHACLGGLLGGLRLLQLVSRRARR